MRVNRVHGVGFRVEWRLMATSRRGGTAGIVKARRQ